MIALPSAKDVYVEISKKKTKNKPKYLKTFSKRRFLENYHKRNRMTSRHSLTLFEASEGVKAYFDRWLSCEKQEVLRKAATCLPSPSQA